MRNGAAKLLKARKGQTQGRLDGFFTVQSTVTTAGSKRKVPESDKNSKKGKSKGAATKKAKK